jgi:phosphoserine phosphatase
MEGVIFQKLYSSSKGNTAPSAWTKISHILGPEAQIAEEKTKDKWNNHEYQNLKGEDHYIEWMKDTINEVHKKHELKRDIFYEVMNSTPYMPGIHELFENLRNKGIVTVLISGGFKAQADRAQSDLLIDHAFAACDYIWNKDGTLKHWNLLPCDYRGKVDFMQLTMKEYGFEPDQCAFIGDGRIDVYMAQAVGTSFAFNGPKELQDVSTHVINQEIGKQDISVVLDFLGYR